MRNTMIKKLLLNQGKYETIEGIPPLTLEKSLGKDLRDYKIYGNSFQDGTPTPDTPVEVESVGEYDEATGKYKVPVVTQGKNLFDVDTYGELKDKNNQPYVLDISKFAVGTKLTVSTKDAYYYKICDTAGGAGKYQYKSNNYTFTLKQEHIDLGYLFFISTTTWNPETKENLLNQDVLIEFGDTKTDFEPYIDETYTTNIYLPEPLRKVGEYADYVDFANGKVVKCVGVKTFNGSEAWVKHTTTKEGYGVFRSDNLLTPLINAPITATFMTHSKLTDKASTADFAVSEYRFTYSNGLIIGSRLYISAYQTTVEDFAQWLSENKPKLYYPIATPTETPIELPKLPTLKGTTVLDTKTNLALSNMSVVYKRR